MCVCVYVYVYVCGLLGGTYWYTTLVLTASPNVHVAIALTLSPSKPLVRSGMLSSIEGPAAAEVTYTHTYTIIQNIIHTYTYALIHRKHT